MLSFETSSDPTPPIGRVNAGDECPKSRLETIGICPISLLASIVLAQLVRRRQEKDGSKFSQLAGSIMQTFPQVLKNVKVAAVMEDQKPPQLVYNPGHPDADPATGMVAMPNVNVVTEMVNMISANGAYKAAAEVVNVTKDMASAVRRLAERS